MQEKERYLIGELAEQAGVNRETLRYYARRGLLNPARRTASGYRIYDGESAARLLFIKRAQAFGFSLAQIHDLLGLKPENPRSCNRVMKMIDGKIQELAEQIREMQRFHRLARYRIRCEEALSEGGACPVILEVTGPGEVEKPRKGLDPVLGYRVYRNISKRKGRISCRRKSLKPQPLRARMASSRRWFYRSQA